jgi:enoyl-CoA hydratase/carnithine racemase
MKYVIYEKKGNVAWVTLNRPAKYNAINGDMVKELCNVWEDFKRDDNLFVSILSANGKHFCSGVDVGSMGESSMGKQDFEVDDCTPTTMEVWKPIIAAMHGICLGAGVFLALGCDLRVVSEDAQFGIPEARLNIASVRALRLTNFIPRGIAYEMVFTTERINAKRAYEVGLINKVVPKDQLLEEATEMANKICKNGPLALKYQKMAFEMTRDINLPEAERFARQMYSPIRDSEDSKEGIAAFKEKRDPVWKVK